MSPASTEPIHLVGLAPLFLLVFQVLNFFLNKRQLYIFADTSNDLLLLGEFVVGFAGSDIGAAVRSLPFCDLPTIGIGRILDFDLILSHRIFLGKMKQKGSLQVQTPNELYSSSWLGLGSGPSQALQYNPVLLPFSSRIGDWRQSWSSSSSLAARICSRASCSRALR